jgi:hypothetical protein
MGNSVTSRLLMLMEAWQSFLRSSSGPDMDVSPGTGPAPGAEPELESALWLTRVPPLGISGVITLIRHLKGAGRSSTSLDITS